jgi:hypothetical protein
VPEMPFAKAEGERPPWGYFGLPSGWKPSPLVAGLRKVLPRAGYALVRVVSGVILALVRVFGGVILATPAEGVRMLVCPSSQRTRTRRGSSWSTSSITPARPVCEALSDSTTILSPT